VQCVEKSVAVVVDGREVFVVDGLDVGNRGGGEAATVIGDADPTGAGIVGVLGAIEEFSGLEFAGDLAGHHRVDADVVGQLSLGGGLVVVSVEPPEGREQHELDVSEVVGIER